MLALTLTFSLLRELPYYNHAAEVNITSSFSIPFYCIITYVCYQFQFISERNNFSNDTSILMKMISNLATEIASSSALCGESTRTYMKNYKCVHFPRWDTCKVECISDSQIRKDTAFIIQHTIQRIRRTYLLTKLKENKHQK